MARVLCIGLITIVINLRVTLWDNPTACRSLRLPRQVTRAVKISSILFRTLKALYEATRRFFLLTSKSRRRIEIELQAKKWPFLRWSWQLCGTFHGALCQARSTWFNFAKLMTIWMIIKKINWCSKKRNTINKPKLRINKPRNSEIYIFAVFIQTFI